MRRRERIGGTAIQWPRLFRTRAARRHLRLTAGNRPTFQPADARCGTLGALDENRWRRPSSRISLPGFNEAAAMAAEKPATATTPPPARAGFNEAAARAAEKRAFHVRLAAFAVAASMRPRQKPRKNLPSREAAPDATPQERLRALRIFVGLRMVMLRTSSARIKVIATETRHYILRALYQQ